MALNLTPLKVKIGLKDDGMAAYPNFNVLSTVQATGMDWSRYVDVYGNGWQYDKQSGHKEQTLDSPYGQQWGVLLVPLAFAQEAVITFPTICEIIDEVALEDFYDNKAHKHEPDEIFSLGVLQGIKMKQDLSLILTADQEKAINPEDDTPGIVKNKKKKWTDYKTLMDINIVTS